MPSESAGIFVLIGKITFDPILLVLDSDLSGYDYLRRGELKFCKNVGPRLTEWNRFEVDFLCFKYFWPQMSLQNEIDLVLSF